MIPDRWRPGYWRSSDASGLVLKSDAARDLIPGLKALSKNKAYLSSQVTGLLVHRNPPESTEPSPDVLTSRETEVLRGLAEGMSNKEVAASTGY